jgi:hypothetical protein
MKAEGGLMTLDRLFIAIGLLYLGVGVFLGSHMGKSMDYAQMPTHAHIVLVGWVSMAVIGLIYKAWPAMMKGWLPWVQFLLYQAGTLALIVFLYIIYGGIMPQNVIGPYAGLSVLVYLISWVIFVWLFLARSGKKT